MKKLLLVFLFLIIVGMLGVLSKNGGTISLQNFFSFPAKKATITIRNHSFTVELAKAEKEQILGLSGRSLLDTNAGMLFLFEKKAQYVFWMKDMKFPLDIIYIQDSHIVDIFNAVPNPTIFNNSIATVTPHLPASQVLEINAGLSHKYGFIPGDTVILSL